MPQSEVADLNHNGSTEEGFQRSIDGWRSDDHPRRRASDNSPKTPEEIADEREEREYQRMLRRAEMSKRTEEIRSIKTESRIKSALAIGICTLCTLGGVLVAMAVTPPKR